MKPLSALPALAATALLLVGAASCAGRQRQALPERATGPKAPTVVQRTLSVALDNGDTAQLGASLYLPPGDSKRPAVILVPGGGRVSRLGTRAGNGSRAYPKPVNVADRFARALARRGHLVLAYDKRTCGPRESPSCRRNPTADRAQLGPVALARDVDAACALVRQEPRSNGDIVLWSHGQGVAVTLAASCAKTARAYVWIAPIPGPVDAVLVRGLSRRAELLLKWGKQKRGTAEGEAQILEGRKLQGQAANFRDVFRTLDAGGFPEDALVLGASPAFWQGWRALTANATSVITAAPAPRLIVLGQLDSQYAPADKNRIAKMGEGENAAFLVIEGGDHHLLMNGKLQDTTVQHVIDALDELLAKPGV